MKIRMHRDGLRGIVLVLLGILLFIATNLFFFSSIWKDSDALPGPSSWHLMGLYLALNSLPIIMMEVGARSIKNLVQIKKKIDNFEKKASRVGDKILLFIVFFIVILAGYVISHDVSKYSLKDIYWVIGPFFVLLFGHYSSLIFLIIYKLVSRKTRR